MALILGTNGNDVGSRLLWGTQSADIIYGFAGNDLIHGNDGNDRIYTGAGYDTVIAGSGDDTVTLESWQGALDGGSGADTLVLAYATATTSRFDLAAGTGRVGYGGQFTSRGFENITTGAAQDTVYGTAGRNIISTGDGHDTVYAADGADVIDAGAGNDMVNAGSGDDLVRGGAGNDRFVGGAGMDTLSFAGDKAVSVDLLAGKATTGPGDVDSISGFERFVGSSDSDRFIGGTAAADFFGGAGDDSFASGTGANVFEGGSGSDWATYASSTGAVIINLATGAASGGSATGDHLVSVENLFASNGADQITGSAAANALYGLAGSDEISAGAGKDVLIGGAGKDALTGGADADIFYFSSDDAGSRDMIHDFQRGQDKIYLAMDGNADQSGLDDFVRLTHFASPETDAGFAAGTINVRYDGQKTIVELDTSDAIVHGRDAAEFSIELSGRLDLQFSDFIL